MTINPQIGGYSVITEAGPMKNENMDGQIEKLFIFCWYLVGVEHFAGERIVPQGTGWAGTAVIQHLSTVLHLLLILSLQICSAL